MKIFISHKKEDGEIARSIYSKLNKLYIDSYLDLLDDSITGDGKELTDHIKLHLRQCTDIIVVLSQKTKLSWWVPFEVGMSAQVEMPTACFLSENINLPSYLSYWPRLKNDHDISQYVSVRKSYADDLARFNVSNLYEYRADQVGQKDTAAFYRELKSVLR